VTAEEWRIWRGTSQVRFLVPSVTVTGPLHTVASSCSFVRSLTHPFHAFPVGAFASVRSFFPPTTPFCKITLQSHLATTLRMCLPRICPRSSSQISQSDIPGVYWLCAQFFLAYFRVYPSIRHSATAASLFAFPGSLTRYTLSIPGPTNEGTGTGE
jgi:hypothetical protein